MELLDTEAIQIVTNQGRERMQRKGGISQEKKGSLVKKKKAALG